MALPPRDMGTLPAGMEALQRVAFDVSGVKDRVTAVERKMSAGTAPGAVPIGGIIDYYGTTEPAGWLFPTGQAIPAQYTTAIALIGANTPDLRGRVTVALDNMGGVDAARLGVANTLGGSGGTETVTLTSAQSGLPAHTHTFQVKVTSPGGGTSGVAGSGAVADFGGLAIGVEAKGAQDAASAHSIMQPYVLVNKLIRVG